MRNERVGRGVATILIAGTALGLVHNWAGLRSRPPHGIPWVYAEPAAVTLESLLGDSALVATEPTGGVAEMAPSTPTPSTPAQSGSEPVRAPVPGTDRRASSPAARDTPPASASPPARGAEETPSAPARRSGPLPFIPDSDRPIEVGLAVAKAFFEAGGALFIDAREADEYAAGHIPNAIRMTHNDAMVDPDRLRTLPVRGRPIIAYCSGGDCEASHDLARDLIGAGHHKVMVYTGGFPEWSSSGQPTEKGTP